jgi:hypothetical protein
MLGEGGEGNGWQGGEGARERRGGKGMEKEGISPPNIQTKLRPCDNNRLDTIRSAILQVTP